MWSHLWTEPRPARLHLFAADIVPVDRTTRERAASGSQNGAQRLAAARRDDVAEHAASQSADDQARRAIGLFAIIIASRIAIDLVIVAKHIAAIVVTAAIAAAKAAVGAASKGHGGGSRRGENGNTPDRSEEHTSELQSLMRNSYAVFCLKKKN